MAIDGTRRWINLWAHEPQRRASLWRQITPPQLFVASFLAVIALGAIGLRTLPGLYTGAGLDWKGAIFTSASAVCVTGLMLVNPATYFTTAGQAFLLLLIQLGGLGMITFSTLIILALGRRLSLRHEQLVSPGADVAPQVRARLLTRTVIRFTLLIEAAGAVVLYLAWAPSFGWKAAVWPAVFHSVNAFCNGGFSIFPDSLIGFQRSPVVLIVIMLLVVAGGLGFLTIEEAHLWHRSRRGGPRFRLSLHSRLALVTSAVLIVGGWALFTLFEWGVTLAELPLPHKLINSLFLSVTPRTAGFYLIDYARATDSTNFLTILFMFVGGSPGSTAGGVKTTTIALLVLLAWSRFRGRETTNIWGRTIPEETMQRAVGLALTAFAVLTVCIFLYTYTEHTGIEEGHARFLTIMFEAAAAFTTAGLSMGATTTLSEAGQWITLFLMFVGRVGPLTFAAALALAAHRGRRDQFRYAHEDVVVG